MTPDGNLEDVVAAVWRRHRTTLFERLSTIERAIAAASAGALDDEMRAAAQSNAHKLAGSLGTFGLGGGTAAALRLEAGFDEGTTIDCAAAGRDAKELRLALESRA